MFQGSDMCGSCLYLYILFIYFVYILDFYLHIVLTYLYE